jgi:DNA modification methylase
MQEGFRFLACEKEQEYVEIAEARLAHWHERDGLRLPIAAGG